MRTSSDEQKGTYDAVFLGLVRGKAILACGRTNRSATEDVGGDRGSEVRKATLLGEPDIESRLRARVGVNSGPSSCERKRDESRDSIVSRRKWGSTRYITEADSSPNGCVIEGKLCVLVCNDDELGDNGIPGNHN